MSGVIDVDDLQAGLPPPLVLNESEASQVIHVLRQDRSHATIVQLIATRNGEGTSTLARDLSLVAAGTNGLRTMLLASEPPGRRADWPRSIYGMPATLRQMVYGPDWLTIVGVGDSPLVLAAPTVGPVLQPPAWTGLIRELRANFDLVVIDSPALQRAFTGVMLAPHTDAN